jgi:DNA-binding transcriptional LysR family regulator
MVPSSVSSTALRYFAEVHRRGSFRAAAENLFVAPSAVSRRVALLEEQLDAPLFERGRGRTRLKLTAAGELVIQYVRNSENELQQVRSSIEALKGMRKGAVRFGVPETFSRHFIPNFLARFNKIYPRITFHVEVSSTPTLAQMLVSDELDAICGFNAPPMADLLTVFERTLRTCIVVSHDHPLASRQSVRLSDCAGHAIALPDESISVKPIFDEMFAKAKLRPQPVLTSNSYEMLRSVSVAGMSIAMVNEHMRYPDDGSPDYRYIPIRDPRVKPQRFALCVRRGRSLSVAAHSFIEHLHKDLLLAKPS